MGRSKHGYLPTGTVTLLFADVEGSSRLWLDQPEAMASATARLDAMLPAVVARHHGVRPVEQGERDGFVVAFPLARDALRCALELQRASLAPVGLRIGIHTGEPQLRGEGGYIGPAVDRAARLRDLAHGGQTVLSGTAHDLVADQLPDDIWLSDLGIHRLRDLPRPERVAQLCHPDLRVEFPALRSGGAAARCHLPRQLTSFVGRTDQLAEIRRLVRGNQLVTLTGAGGAGKTRLAVQAATELATEFDSGAWFVDLALVAESDDVAQAVAVALGVPDRTGRGSLDALAGFVGEQRFLIVLDNCEHLLDGVAAVLVSLLSECPNLTVLATSRESIGVAGEVLWRVPPLSLADDAVQLFSDRAGRLRPDLTFSEDDCALIADVCRRLDGMPLAIELAAARLRSMSLAEIAGGLNDRLRLLGAGSSASSRRQRSLAASVEWSHALLTDGERVAFRRLAVFRGTFDLGAALAVAGVGALDEVTALVDKSLVTAETSHRRTRYRMLETIRQFAQEKLVEAGEDADISERHRRHYAAVAASIDRPARGTDRSQIDCVEEDFSNLRAAFRWSLASGDADAALTLAATLQPLWLGRGRLQEGVAWFRAALPGDGNAARAVTPAVHARAVAEMALLTVWLGTADTGEQVRNALDVARGADDPLLLTRVLTACGAAHGHDPASARMYFDEALWIARRIADTRRLVQILGWQAYLGFVAGDPTAMCAAAEEGGGLAESIGDGAGLQQFRWLLALARMIRGDLDGANAQFRHLAAEAEGAREYVWRTVNLIGLARSLAYRGDAGAALETAKTALDATEQLGAWYRGLAYAALSTAALAAGDSALADSAVSSGLSATDTEPKSAARVSDYAAEAALARGDLHQAVRCADTAVASTAGWHLSRALTTRARVAMARGGDAQAERDVHKALIQSAKLRAHLGLPDTLECAAMLAGNAGSHPQAARLFGAADGIRRGSGESRFPQYDADYRAALAAVRDSLGEKDFESAWSKGAALSVDEAIAYAQRGRGERRRRPSHGWESLTPAEHEIAVLVGDGLPNKEVAARLFVSPKTVATHLTHIYSKVRVSNRVQLAQEARRWAGGRP